MEYVALHDIQPGEEVFIHYGAAWEKAWENHVKNWTPLPGSKDYVSANDMNHDVEAHDIIRTVEEQETNPYPHSVVTSCYYDYDPEENGLLDKSGKFADPNDHNVVIKQWMSMGPNVPDYLFLHPCAILEHHNIDESSKDAIDHDYTIHILNYDHMNEDQKVPDYKYLIVEGVP